MKTKIERWITYIGGNEVDVIQGMEYTKNMKYAEARKYLKNIWPMDLKIDEIACIKVELDQLYESREYVAKNRHLVLDPEASMQISRMGAYNDEKIVMLELKLRELENNE
jgi:hypothetical protein